MLADGYSLRDGAAPASDAAKLRVAAGLSAKTVTQTAAAAAGTWFGVHVVATDGTIVGMGRVIGDGGWYFHIVDMAVLAEHQRRGIGDAVLRRLVDRIHQAAPPDPYITLLADSPGRPVYRRHGFVETAPGSLGMVLATSSAPAG